MSCTRDIVIYFRFHQNLFRGFEVREVKICPFPLLWLLAFTTACTTVQGVIGIQHLKFQATCAFLFICKYTLRQKGRHQTRSGNSVNSQPIFNFFTVRFASKLAAKCLVSILPSINCVTTLPCETLTSENEQQSQTNTDKLLGTVVTYLRCSGIFSNQNFKKRFIVESASESFFLTTCLYYV